MPQGSDIQQLSVSLYQDKQWVRAIDCVDFALHPGETLALLGESGCGKSLTAMALMRLLPASMGYHPDSRIEIDDQDLLAISEQQIRQWRGKRIAVVFQEPMTALNPVLCIRDQISESLLQHQKLSQRQLMENIVRLLHEVELHDPEHLLHKYPHQLSGGQKQRVVIAMALANHPDILIADEPTTALDVTIQAQIIHLLKKIQKEYNMSMLLITHDLGVVKAMADRVCLMYAGQIVEQAPVNLFFQKEMHPYAQQLLAAQPNIHLRGYRLANILGQVPPLDSLPTGCRFHPRCGHAFERCQVEEPILQTIEEQQIRCHLYPTIKELSPLKPTKEALIQHISGEEVILEVNNLNVHFEMKSHFLGPKQLVRAVNGLSFELKKGKTLALVGESGCGKTTTSRAILRLLPISAGNIVYRGKKIHLHNQQDALLYRQKVQAVFQDPYASLNPRMTIEDIIAEGLAAQRVPKPIIQQKLVRLLDQVGLPISALHRYPHQFSGGQRQRIGIARALAIEPEIIICDEPTSALDISIQAQILNLLKDLQAESHLSYLFITHNMAVVSYMADDVLVMRDGKCVESGACEQVFSNPEHPYTVRLLNSILPVL